MTDTAMVPARTKAARPRPRGVELLGPDGLLSQVTKAVLERALAEEMTGHLGYEKHDPAGRGSGNSRNGMTSKTGLTSESRRGHHRRHVPVHRGLPPRHRRAVACGR